MLTKCVCPSCGHAYLAEENSGAGSCPRCKVGGAGAPPPPPPQTQKAHVPGFPPPMAEDREETDEFPSTGYLDDGLDGVGSRFAPQAPPPMVINRERFLRGLIFGSLTALATAAVLAAALASIGVALPAVTTLIFAFVAGVACRSGFSGRAASRSKARAIAVCVVIALFGFAGFFGGSWAVDRFTGDRAAQTRDDLEQGTRLLMAQRASTEDAGLEVVLDQRIAEAERLRTLNNAQIEDYLWVQQAQINQPLLAYAKLRIMQGPVVRLGPDNDPIHLPQPAPAGIVLGELILAFVIIWRSVTPR